MIVTSTPNYPSGYEGHDVPLEFVEPTPTYIAMGDSFSSGEGNPLFESGSDTSSNECHRSPMAFSRLLQQDTDLDLGPTKSVACSGATVGNIVSSNSGQGGWGEPAQIDALSIATETVTMSIGGNDIGFPEYAKICVVAFCGPGLGQVAYDAIMANINSSAFSTNLQLVYESILDEAPNADIYVIDYPYIFDPEGLDDTGCTIVDASGAVEVQEALNSTIALSVGLVRSQSTDYSDRLHYVNTNAPGSPFEGKHLCTDDPAGSSFIPIILPPFDEEYSLHPNYKGHQAYYSLLSGLLS